MKKITVITPGKGREVCVFDKNTEPYDYGHFMSIVKTFPAFFNDEKTELPKGWTGEVDTVYQIWEASNGGFWTSNCKQGFKSFIDFNKYYHDVETRVIYVAPLTDAQPFKEADEIPALSSNEGSSPHPVESDEKQARNFLIKNLGELQAKVALYYNPSLTQIMIDFKNQ